MRSLFTDQGLNKMITASILGPQLSIYGVKISGDLVDPNKINVGAYTNLNNIVWSGDTRYIRYQAKVDTNSNSKVITYVVTLDESVPTCDFGIIGLYSGNTLMTVTCLDKIEHRIQGNRNVYDILFGINGSAETMAIDVILPAECSIPYISSTASLPSIIEAPYNAYSCGIHEQYGIPCIAARGTTEWQYYFPSKSTESLPTGTFASNVNPGDLVYFNTNTSQMELANTATGAIGFRGDKDNLVTSGVYINPAISLIPGAYYYVGDFGKLTTVPNNCLVGQAVNSTTLCITVFTETYMNKSNTINMSRASTRFYPSEKAIVDLYNNTLNGDITVNGHWSLPNAKVYWM